MAVRNDFSSGEVLTAADLNDTFASKLPYSYGTATPSTSDDGFLWYDSNSTPAEVKFWDGAAFQAIGGGTILQIVRATDGTDRTTSSSSYVDASISVTITPTKNTSAILLLWSVNGQAYVTSGTNANASFVITDSSNNIITGEPRIFIYGASAAFVQTDQMVTVIAYDTPATTSATTYKGRFKLGAGTGAACKNTEGLGQLYAIEVSA